MRPSVRWLEENYHDRIDFHYLNFDDLGNAALIEKYRITGVPTVILLDADGNLVQKYVGYMTQDQLVQIVEALLAQQAAPSP